MEKQSEYFVEESQIIEIVIEPDEDFPTKRNLTFQVDIDGNPPVVICFENTRKNLADLFDVFYYASEEVLSKETIGEYLGIKPPSVINNLYGLRDLLGRANAELRHQQMDIYVDIESFKHRGYSLSFKKFCEF